MSHLLEYERAGKAFTEFLVDVKREADFRSNHMAYTMAHGGAEVAKLRAEHNFSHLTEAPIRGMAKALRRHVNEERFDRTLESLSEGARDFWAVSPPKPLRSRAIRLDAPRLRASPELDRRSIICGTGPV